MNAYTHYKRNNEEECEIGKKEKIILLWAEGKHNQKEIAEKVGCSPPYVNKIVKNIPLQLTPKLTNPKVKLTTEKVEVVQDQCIQYDNFDRYYEESFQPDLNDTRNWDWPTWASYFMDVNLFDYQVENLIAIDTKPLNIINDPRRHGKTTVCIAVFIIRKLCETVWAGENEFIAYMSAVKSNVEQLSLMIITNLTFNEKILQNYGYIIKETSRKGRKLQKNTMTEITLKTRKIPFGSSYVGFMVSGRFRGAGARYVLIDDAIDTFEDKAASLKLQTDKLIHSIKSRIMPVVKDGFISIIGTRYSLDDVYNQLEEEGIWELQRRRTLPKCNFIDGYEIPELGEGRKLKPSDIIIHSEEEWDILAPQLWCNLAKDPSATALQNIIFMYITQGDRIFSSEFQNEPKPLISVLKWEDFNEIDFIHPPEYSNAPHQYYQKFNWCAFYDDASGESKGSDYRAIVLCAARNGECYFVDQLYFRDIASGKIRRIEEFIRDNEERYGVQISLLVEVVRNQREVFQRLRDESNLVVQSINPRGRGDKEYRIQNNFAVLLEQGKLFLNRNIRQKHILKKEIEGFPYIHPDGLDAWDQAIFHFNRSKPVRLGMEVSKW